MAYGSVNVPMRSDYLPLTGGTVDGKLTVTGTITGNVIGDLNGNASTATNASKWNGKVLRQNHNATDTWIPVFSGNYVDYVLKSEITQALENRVVDCEAKVKAIGGATEVLIRTAVSSTVTYDNMRGNATIANAESACTFVTIYGRKILRGSNVSMMISSIDQSAGGYTAYLYGIFTFNSSGAITVKVDSASSYQPGDFSNSTFYKWNFNIGYYRYAA